MTAAVAPRFWNETDIPAVAPAHLMAALSLWLALERRGMVVVGEAPLATPESIGRAIVAMHDDPAVGLGVLHRLRSLAAALATRRFRHLARPDQHAALARLVAAAASLRLNPTWGMSPLRLAWAMAAADAAETREAA